MQVNLVYCLTAMVLGAFHALEPGHGKTVVAAYLVGTRGRKIDAVLLGFVVTLTHTSSVILLAVLATVASTQIEISEQSLHGYLGIIAGFIIVAVGIWMLVCRIRGREPFHSHSHDHGHSHNDNPSHGHMHNYHDNRSEQHHHPHGHHNSGTAEGVNPHSHDDNNSHSHDHYALHAHNTHPHGHSHNENHVHDHEGTHEQIHRTNDSHKNHHQGSESRIEDRENPRRVGFWQLFLLGVSGGLVPCPAAIAVLLAAVGSGRMGEALTYVLLFSVGLAAALIVIGVVVVVGAEKIANRFFDAKQFARKVSIGSAALISILGVVTVIASVRHLL